MTSPTRNFFLGVGKIRARVGQKTLASLKKPKSGKKYIRFASQHRFRLNFDHELVQKSEDLKKEVMSKNSVSEKVRRLYGKVFKEWVIPDSFYFYFPRRFFFSTKYAFAFMK